MAVVQILFLAAFLPLLGIVHFKIFLPFFIWSGKGNKIKRNVMMGDYSDGGLKMIDLESFNKAPRSIWVKKYFDPENYGKWKYFLTQKCSFLVGLPSLEATSNRDDLPKYVFLDLFAMEILQIWSEVDLYSVITTFHLAFGIPTS